MAMVQCKACGKIYDYEKNGCCPSCGAYNRPPRRERVDADGTVHHLTGQERRSVPRGGKVCFEKKECHEKKVCFEDEARKKPAHRSFSLTSGQRVLLVFMLFVVLGIIASFASSGRLHWGGSREPDTPSYPVTPATQEPAVSQDWLDWVPWQGGQVGLLGASYEDGVLQVELEIQRDPGDVLLDDFWLYCVDEDGQELTRAVSDASCQEQYWTLHFDLSADWYDNLQYVELQLLAPDGTQDGFLLLLYQGDGALAG